MASNKDNQTNAVGGATDGNAARKLAPQAEVRSPLDEPIDRKSVV